MQNWHPWPVLTNRQPTSKFCVKFRVGKKAVQVLLLTQYRHAVEREALYNGAPLLYDNAASQRGHHDAIRRHYDDSDRAAWNQARHEDWEK